VEEIDEVVLEGADACGGDDAVVAGALDDGADAQIWIAEQHDLGARMADEGDASDQSLVGEHGHVGGDAVEAAAIDLEGTPPIGGVADDDTSQLDSPGGLTLPFEVVAEAFVFAHCLLGLEEAEADHLVFTLEAVGFTDQIAAGNDKIGRVLSQLLGGGGQSEKREKETADGQFESGHGLAWQIEYYDDQHKHQSQSYEMRPI
jgi:hypothetical protein